MISATNKCSHAWSRFIRQLLLLVFIGSMIPQAATAQMTDVPVTSNLDVLNCDLSVTISNTFPNCDGATVCLNIQGGVPPYTITLNGENADNTATGLALCFQNLAPGNYTVKIADAQGCTTGVEFSIPVVDYLLQATVKNVTCNNGSDGSIDLDIPIDVAPIFFKWTGPNGFFADTEDIKNLRAGIYNVQVYGINGICYGIGKWEVTEPPPIKIDIAIAQPVCGNANVCALVSGGVPPYRAWGFLPLPAGINNGNFDAYLATIDLTNGVLLSPTISNTQTTFCKNDISGGLYAVIIQDANGCFAWKIFEVRNAATFERRVEVKDLSCHGRQDGSICFKIGGGTPPYKNVLTSANGDARGIEGESGCFDNLPAGEYILTTTDGTGCSLSERVRVNEPAPLEAAFNVTNQSCTEGTSGCLKVAGGTRPYRIYAWVHPNPTADVGFEIGFWDNGTPYIIGAARATAFNFPPTSASNNLYCARNIPPGDYILLVVDANNCYEVVVVHIPPAGGLQASFEITSNVCDENVSGCLKVSGGTRPYQIFVWHRLNPNNTDPAINLEFDAAGNPRILNTDILPTDQMYFDPEDSDPSVPPHYRRCARNIPPGHYVIVIVDANRCYAILQVRIPPANPLHARFEITSQSCEAGVDGCLYVEGGTMPYDLHVWRWNSPLTVIPQVRFDADGNPHIEDADRVENFPWGPTPAVLPYRRCADDIPPGYYLILVVDTNRCYTLLPVIIPDTTGLRLSAEVKNVSCNAAADGRITLQIGGGMAPYTVFFNDISNTGEVTDDLTVIFDNLAAGAYSIKVYDKNQCGGAITLVVKEPEPLLAAFELRRPACDTAVGGCLNIKGGTRPYRVQIWRWTTLTDTLPEVLFDETTNTYSISGAIPTDLTLTPPTPGTNNNLWCIRHIPPGNYLFLVLDANGCYFLLPVRIPPADTIQLRAEVTDPACNSTGGGTIKLHIAGGIPPYQIRFAGGARTTRDTMILFENVLPGTYTITVYDDRQCAATITVVVGQGGIRSNLAYNPYGTFACVMPEGGIPPYKIEWLDLQTGQSISNDTCVRNLAPGAYWVTIFDNAGCSTQEWVIIDPQPCEGGIASVNPESIASGERTKFSLRAYAGISIQWQFRTEFTDWINIPGATAESYTTPPINTGTSKVIFVRAEVTCADGTVVYSTETAFKVRGSNLLLPIAAFEEDPQLFNPAFRLQELQTLTRTAQPERWSATVYPTISNSLITIRFGAFISGDTKVYLLNSIGTVLLQEQIDNASEGETMDLSLHQLAAGTYFVKIENQQHLETHRIIVIK